MARGQVDYNVDERLPNMEGIEEWQGPVAGPDRLIDPRLPDLCVQDQPVVLIYEAVEGVLDRLEHVVGVDAGVGFIVEVRDCDPERDANGRGDTPHTGRGHADVLSPGGQELLIP